MATAYQERLQHAIGWYRVTTCELVERIDYGRRQGEYGKPTLKRTPTGEWRQVYPPIILDRVNVLLPIGRGDPTFAPPPAAAAANSAGQQRPWLHSFSAPHLLPFVLPCAYCVPGFRRRHFMGEHHKFSFVQ